MAGLQKFVDSLGDAVRIYRSSPNAVPVAPVPNRWFLEPGANERVQGLVERVINSSGRPRESFTSGAFVDPRTGEILDDKIFASGVVDSFDGRKPFMAVGQGVPIASDGPLLDSNLVRRKGLWSSDELDQPFIATLEAPGSQHYYGRGIDYQVPVLLRNNLRQKNPTLRPRARGSIYGVGDQYRIRTNAGKEHMVHDMLRVLSRDPDGPKVPGTATPFGTLLRYSLLAPVAAQGLSED